MKTLPRELETAHEQIAGGTGPEPARMDGAPASLAGLFALAAVPSGFLWLAFGAAARHLVHGRRRLRIFTIAMAALLALSIVLIVR